MAFDEHPNVKRHEVRSGYGWLSPLLAQQTGRPYFKIKTLRSLLASQPYDVIHFHNMSLFGPHALKIEPRNSGSIKVYTAHEHWLVCPMHVLWKFGRKPCNKPHCLPCTLLGRRPPQIWRYTGQLDQCARHVDQFIAPSHFTARVHAERGFSQPMEYLPQFAYRVDNDWKTPLPRPHERPYFLFVGRLVPIKGLQTLIPLFERFTKADLLVCGEGSNEQQLRALAGSNPRIKFLGRIPQSQIGPLYNHALACIVPSIAYETFGMVSIEAFARKTPVICRDHGGLPEVVQESGGGFTYQNDAELAIALDRIADSPELRAELGENGYRHFIDKWSDDAHLRAYFELLQRVACRKFGQVPWHASQSTADRDRYKDVTTS
jgi:glycosyltransferase involved in cell wall biosynthesis